MEEGVRIDKWLWSVRIFKTRNQATLACRSGRVKISDQPVKPSREIKTGEVITINLDALKRSVKVIAPVGHRVSAKLVEKFMEDITPTGRISEIENS